MNQRSDLLLIAIFLLVVVFMFTGNFDTDLTEFMPSTSDNMVVSAIFIAEVDDTIIASPGAELKLISGKPYRVGRHTILVKPDG